MLDYSVKPDPVFHGRGPLHLGMELEITVPRGDLAPRAEDSLSALGGLGYLKDDSSISHGFELVTHPMSYDWALDHFPWDLLPRLYDQGCSADDNGLHVHISRAAFTGPCHVYRWMKFVYRNQDAVETLARRSSQYAGFHDDKRILVKETCKGARGFIRHAAINTLNSSTLELRVFAGSLAPQQVQAALGFADASVHYTRDLAVADIARHRGWDWSRFATWLLTNPRYLPLTRELEDLACAC
ncbi:hypothetical protein FPZ12_024085 [Amycolatopsis acidicola]|uniref:Amidoligase enzyme n=1 Tax=Amycolatopsis acidicola TaxID=2596893 RepID=A0A5N0V110_9PSEU|nr:hypothetical protein FPZ12_024085 [Amycolatopsis acidicola]